MTKPSENRIWSLLILANQGENRMEKNTYKVLSEFECCGVDMVTVIIEGKVACVMPEREYNRIIETERKYRKRKNCKVA